MSNQTINIGIADDHQLFREGLAMIISQRHNFRLVIEASNGRELMDAIDDMTEPPDVVLLDLKMPVLDGMETTKVLKQEFPSVKILILTMLDQDDYIIHLLDLGANGYLLKNASATEVQQAIATVVSKDFYFSDRVSKAMLTGLQKKHKRPTALNPHAQITAREQEVLEHLAREHTTSEIAERLYVSDRTVETHRKNLMEKLGARNVAGLVYRAMREGLLS